ncbi:MAG TPA: hypothetical protein VHL34_24260 [Rhizomicrobium sp.]|jgi:hypothetical protein|nr:hypothetical protein [Rhizomicrobium sp.]
MESRQLLGIAGSQSNIDAATDARRQTAFRAAKVQVLGLAPLKEKLGPRWDRLSGLVHKLFERTIQQAQGRTDRVFAIDELSYVATFHDLSEKEAQIACASIANEVCKQLYGDQIDEISVRTLVGGITEPGISDTGTMNKMIESLLETRGTETVLTKSAHADSKDPVVTVPPRQQQTPLPNVQEIHRAHMVLNAQRGLRIGFFPVWELRKGVCNTIYVAPYAKMTGSYEGRACVQNLPEDTVTEIEIMLLNCAAAYARAVNESGTVAAISVGVSFDTLAAFRLRIRYVTALQKLSVPASSPILLKIENVPNGTPISRLAEIVAMLRMTNVKAMVEFQSMTAIPDLDLRVGAIGFGGLCPKYNDGDAALRGMERIVQAATTQKAFAFLDKLDSAALVDTAIQANVRFGTGRGLGNAVLTGLEKVPRFPLRLNRAVRKS